MNDYSSEAIEEVSSADLIQVSQMALQQVSFEKLVAKAEVELKEAKKKLRQIAEFDLPDLMSSIGIEGFTLSDGSSITIKEDWKASVTNKNRDFVMNWLMETNNDGIISNEIKVLFGKGDDDAADELYSLLGSDGQEVYKNKSVNTSTLKALCRELMGNGVDVPIAELGMFVVKKAIIK